MKQCITDKQFKELSPPQLRRLEDRLQPDVKKKLRWEVNYYNLDIGQMINLLSDYYVGIFTTSEVEGSQWVVYTTQGRAVAENLVDALWEAVKKVLKKQ